MNELKTLKDFDYTLCTIVGIRYYEKNHKTENISMTEKTKKISIDELRQSGIDDIKKMEKNNKKEEKIMLEQFPEMTIVDNTISNNEAKIEYIKQKFNITEKDLE